MRYSATPMIVQFKSDCGVWFRRVKLKRQRVSAVFSLQKDFQSKFVRSFVRSTLAERSSWKHRFCNACRCGLHPRGRGVAEIKMCGGGSVAQLVKVGGGAPPRRRPKELLT